MLIMKIFCCHIIIKKLITRTTCTVSLEISGSEENHGYSAHTQIGKEFFHYKIILSVKSISSCQIIRLEHSKSKEKVIQSTK